MNYNYTRSFFHFPSSSQARWHQKSAAPINIPPNPFLNIFSLALATWVDSSTYGHPHKKHYLIILQKSGNRPTVTNKSKEIVKSTQTEKNTL